MKTACRILLPILLVSMGTPWINAQEATPIRLVGSDLMTEAFTEGLAAFAKESGQPIDIQLDGSKTGTDALREGTAEIAILAQPDGVTTTLGDGFKTVPLAFHVAIVIVNENNPVKEISIAQLTGVFAESSDKRIATWRNVDPALPIVWDSRNISPNAISGKTSIALELFKFKTLGTAKMKGSVSLWEDIPGLIGYLRENDAALAVVPFVPEGARVNALAIAGETGGFGFGPTPDNIYFGDYTLRLPFNIVYRADQQDRVNALLQHLLSDETAAILANGGFVPVPENIRRQKRLEVTAQE